MDPNCFKAIYLGDVVWFILNEPHRVGLPHNAIVYTLAEAQILAKRSEWAKGMAHEAKKAAGAKIIENWQ